MLVLAHPHGTSSSGYCPDAAALPGSTIVSLKNSNYCPTLASASQQKLYSSVLHPASSTFPLDPRQLRLQPRELLPVAVHGPAVSAPGLLYSGATIGVSGLPSCTPAVFRSTPLQQPVLQQAYVSQIPSTVSVPLSRSVCALPSTKVVSIAPNKASKDKQRLLHKKGDGEGLCEREDKFQQHSAFTLDQQQEERQQRDQQQQPPLWRVPLVRDPLATQAADFNPIPVSEATLVRHLWKHAHAAVEDPTSAPPFRWIPSLPEPHPSYWTDVRQQIRRQAHEQLVQHGQERRTGEYEEQDQHQFVHLPGNFGQDAEGESPEIGLPRAPDENTRRSRRRRSSSTPSRRSHKRSYEEDEWQTRKGAETDAQCGDGEAGVEQSVLLSTRVGRSQSPAYVCPRRDDFTAEQLIDAPAYTTNYMGLLCDTGMHYTKRYELPTISRFLQAKHPVFLRARTSADQRQQQSRPSSRDAVRTRPSRGNGNGRQREREGGSEAPISEHAADDGFSYVLPSIPPMCTSAGVLLQPQTNLQPGQNQVIVPATPLPTFTVSWPAQASPVALAQQHPLELTAPDTGGLELLANMSAAAPTVTAATEGSLMGAAVPLCVVPQSTTTCLPTTLQPGVVCAASGLSSLQSDSPVAATLSRPSLYAHAPTGQQSSTQSRIQCTPEARSSTAASHLSFQPPHTTIYAMASPVACPAVAVATPRFASLASDAKAAAAVPGNVATSSASPRQYRADFPATTTCSTVDHKDRTEVTGQPQQHEQPQTDILLEQGKGVEFKPQQQEPEQQQEQGVSEQGGRTNMQNSKGREEPVQPAPQSESREQLSPQGCVVQREPQSGEERESSCLGTVAFPRFLFTSERPQLLIAPIADATSQRVLASFTPAVPGGDDTFPGNEAKAGAIGLRVAQDAGGVRATGALSAPQATVTLLAGSPFHTGASIHEPTVSATSGAVHPISLLPIEALGASGSVIPPKLRAKKPLEPHGESSSYQRGSPHHHVGTTSPTVCISPSAASYIPAVPPMTHVLLRRQQWQPQIFIPPSSLAQAGQFVG